MNKFSEKILIKFISKSKSINISPLEMIANAGGKSIKSLAINEVSILRQSRWQQISLLKIIPKI